MQKKMKKMERWVKRVRCVLTWKIFYRIHIIIACPLKLLQGLSMDWKFVEIGEFMIFFCLKFTANNKILTKHNQTLKDHKIFFFIRVYYFIIFKETVVSLPFVPTHVFTHSSLLSKRFPFPLQPPKTKVSHVFFILL